MKIELSEKDLKAVKDALWSKRGTMQQLMADVDPAGTEKKRYNFLIKLQLKIQQLESIEEKIDDLLLTQ